MPEPAAPGSAGPEPEPLDPFDYHEGFAGGFFSLGQSTAALGHSRAHSPVRERYRAGAVASLTIRGHSAYPGALVERVLRPRHTRAVCGANGPASAKQLAGTA